MNKLFRIFRKDDEGAVTVDWVVLTAAIIGVAIGAVNQISAATNVVSSNISDGMSDIDVGPGSGSGG